MHNGGAAEQTLFELDEFVESIAEEPVGGVFQGIEVGNAYPTPPPTIKRLWVERMLGFDAVEIDLGQFNVLVGPNNSGKSSLLRIVRFAYTLLRAHLQRLDSTSAHLARGRNLDDSLLPVATVRDLWHRGVRRTGSEWVIARVGMELSTGQVLDFGLKAPFGHATSRVLSDELTLPRRVYDELIEHPMIYVPSSVGVVAEEELRTPARMEALVAGGHVNEVLRNMLLDLEEGDRLADLRQLLDNFFPGNIQTVKFNERLDQFIEATYGGDYEHDLFNVGGGFLQVLQVMTFLVHHAPSVLLVDEPDAHLHSSLQKTLIDTLMSASDQLGIQVLVATHSKEIINYVDPQDLLVVDRQGGNVLALGAHETAISVLESLGSIDSVDAYYVIRRRRVLLVEGPSDIKVLHGLAAKRGTSIFEGESRIVAVPTGGESTPAARSDLVVLERLLDEKVESLQIRDRDARTDALVDAEESAAGRPLHFWRRGSIESYLLIPSAIARILAAEGIGKCDELQDRVETLLAETREDLRDDTFDAAATRWRGTMQRLENRAVEVTEANRVVREELAKDGALELLTDGKAALSLLRKKLQDEFGVTFGLKRLIDEMNLDEVDDELWRVLDRIAELAA